MRNFIPTEMANAQPISPQIREPLRGNGTFKNSPHLGHFASVPKLSGSLVLSLRPHLHVNLTIIIEHAEMSVRGRGREFFCFQGLIPSEILDVGINSEVLRFNLIAGHPHRQIDRSVDVGYSPNCAVLQNDRLIITGFVGS